MASLTQKFTRRVSTKLEDIRKFHKRSVFTFIYEKINYWEDNLLEKLLFEWEYFWTLARILLVLELIISIVIIETIQYHEVDWVAYMEQVKTVGEGMKDYSNLRGVSGLNHYPAGFSYIFLGFWYITDEGVNIKRAQYIHVVIYLATLYTVMKIYHKTNNVPPYMLIALCASYRVHSIYLLRLFNDPLTMLLLYVSIDLFLQNRWNLATFVFSLSMSIKLNVTLYFPALILILWQNIGPFYTFLHLFFSIGVQIVIALPFLMENPWSYLDQVLFFTSRPVYKDTVNWKILPTWCFESVAFNSMLIIGHATLIIIFARKHWIKNLKETSRLFEDPLSRCQTNALILFECNLIGIILNRSLQIQFYIWYFHSLPYLLWSTQFCVKNRLYLLLFLEIAWNATPSNSFSSLLFHFGNIALLYSLYQRKLVLKTPFKELEKHK